MKNEAPASNPLFRAMSAQAGAKERYSATMKKKNYPLYETTKFRDFRVMTEQAATLHGSDTAFSYKKNPNDAEVVKIS